MDRVADIHFAAIARLGLVGLLTLPGCLLLATPPPIEGECVDADLGEELGLNLVTVPTKSGEVDTACESDAVALLEKPITLAWTAPRTARYRFVATGPGLALRVDVGHTECGDVDSCNDIGTEVATVERQVDRGDTVYIKVATSAHAAEVTMSISVEDGGGDGAGGGSTPCPHTNDGECDEPEGTGLCLPGTDALDCG